MLWFCTRSGLYTTRLIFFPISMGGKGKGGWICGFGLGFPLLAFFPPISRAIALQHLLGFFQGNGVWIFITPPWVGRRTIYVPYD